MLKPGHGKTHKAYIWSYCTTQYNPSRAVVFDFAHSRAGQHVRDFLGLPGTAERPAWKGSLVTDDRNNWLFAGSLRAGKRAAAVMSLLHSAGLNGHKASAGPLANPASTSARSA